MARTLGGDPNQVAVKGRKVLVGWLGYAGGKDIAMQSLGRDLTLSKDYELLQQFVPELKMLRIVSSYTHHTVDGDQNDSTGRAARKEVSVPGSALMEVVASFELSAKYFERSSRDKAAVPPSNATLMETAPAFGVTVLGGGATGEYTVTLAMTTKSATVRGKGIPRAPAGGITGPLWGISSTVTLHAIIDKGVIEVIFNNRTAIATNTKLESPNATEISLFVRRRIRASFMQSLQHFPSTTVRLIRCVLVSYRA